MRTGIASSFASAVPSRITLREVNKMEWGGISGFCYIIFRCEEGRGRREDVWGSGSVRHFSFAWVQQLVVS